MGDCGAHDPACAPRWAQTIGQRARGAERDFLHPTDRVSVEGGAQRPAAKEHGARLSGTVELGRTNSPKSCRGYRSHPMARCRDLKSYGMANNGLRRGVRPDTQQPYRWM